MFVNASIESDQSSDESDGFPTPDLEYSPLNTLIDGESSFNIYKDKRQGEVLNLMLTIIIV